MRPFLSELRARRLAEPCLGRGRRGAGGGRWGADGHERRRTAASPRPSERSTGAPFVGALGVLREHGRPWAARRRLPRVVAGRPAGRSGGRGRHGLARGLQRVADVSALNRPPWPSPPPPLVEPADSGSNLTHTLFHESPVSGIPRTPVRWRGISLCRTDPHLYHFVSLHG